MNKITPWVAISLMTLSPAPVYADPPGEARDWQLHRLFQPSAEQQAAERGGRVTIYDGLHDVDVERALDSEFRRVQSMMFVRTVVTDGKGVPQRDESSGEVVVEDDDCD